MEIGKVEKGRHLQIRMHDSNHFKLNKQKLKQPSSCEQTRDCALLA